MTVKKLQRAGACIGIAAAMVLGNATDGAAAGGDLGNGIPWWLTASGYPAGHRPRLILVQAGTVDAAELPPPDAAMPDTAMGTQSSPPAEEAATPAPQVAQADQFPNAITPEKPGVLTRPGLLVVEPSVQYQHTNLNRFVVGGVAILDTVLIGSIVATQAKRDAVTGTLGLRLGMTDRVEGEVRIPYMYRNDQTTNTVISTNATAATTDLSDQGLGDVEGALHYQINEGNGDWPIFVANFRVKSTTGTSPYDVKRDINGIEQELATGSGFWGFEPSITLIAPSDPAVFYGNIGYLYNMPADINKQITSTQYLNRVEPGGAVRMGVGMGISLNEKVAFSLGYQHDWIMESTSQFSNGDFKSPSLNVGTVTFGVNWQINPEAALNVSIGVGVTSDSPDVSLMVRLPVALKVF